MTVVKRRSKIEGEQTEIGGSFMEKGRVRICDIAEELGLSTATVSNVIHGKNHKVSDETVQRVMAALERRQYIPSMAGILLARNDSRIVGVFLHDHEKYAGHPLEDPFIASSLDHLSTEIEKSGQFMMVKKTKCAEEIIRFASMWNMDGIVVIGFCDLDYAYLRNHMRIPFVVYDGIGERMERIVNIVLDDFDGGYQMGCHLRGLGHRKALCVSDNDEGVDRERVRGFRAGFGPGEAELLVIPMGKEPRWACYRACMDRLREVSALFAVSDYYAVDLMCFLAEQGVSVPGEVSVAGFDDTPICEMIRPGLTTVRQDGALRARIAVEKLRELRENGETAARIMLPVSLVARGSTAERKQAACPRTQTEDMKREVPKR